MRSEADKTNESPDWWAVYAGGCTRDQEGLPHHISTEAEITNLVEKALVPLLQNLPTPVLITLARSTDDGYCPPDQVCKFDILYASFLYVCLHEALTGTFNFRWSSYNLL